MDAKPSRLPILAGIFPTNMAVFSQATNSPLWMYFGNGKIICTSTPPMALKAVMQPLADKASIFAMIKKGTPI
jgi:hypothetical protein